MPQVGHLAKDSSPAPHPTGELPQPKLCRGHHGPGTGRYIRAILQKIQINVVVRVVLEFLDEFN